MKIKAEKKIMSMHNFKFQFLTLI